MDIIQVLVAISKASYQRVCDALTEQELNDLRNTIETLKIKETYIVHSEKVLHSTFYPYLGKNFKYPPPKKGKLNNKPKGKKH